MPSRIVTIKTHPDFDYCYAVLGGEPILTKQDKFKPVNSLEAHFENEGDRSILEVYDLYVKDKGKNTHKEFEERLKQQIQETTTNEHPYNKHIPIEVIALFLMDKKRLKTVDVDNLLKSVLDCFKGIIFEDDAQVMNVLGKKREGVTNGLLLGVRRLDTKQTWFKDIHFLSMEEDGNEFWLL